MCHPLILKTMGHLNICLEQIHCSFQQIMIVSRAYTMTPMTNVISAGQIFGHLCLWWNLFAAILENPSVQNISWFSFLTQIQSMKTEHSSSLYICSTISKLALCSINNYGSMKHKSTKWHLVTQKDYPQKNPSGPTLDDLMGIQ